MLALSVLSPGNFEYKNLPIPERAAGHALIRISRVGICGTDYHAYSGNQPFFTYPRILGHEISGYIEEIEENQFFSKGELVTILPYLNCGQCIACRNNHQNCCTHLSVIGVHQDGGLREFISVPNEFLVKSRGLGADQLALVEPLAIAAHGVKAAQVSTGETVLILGAGPIGLGTAVIAKIMGAKVIVADYNQARLDFCAAQLGINHLINLNEEEIKLGIFRLLGDEFPLVIIDCSGNLQAINGALNLLAHSGRIVLIGLQKQEIILSHPEFHKREASLKSSRNALREDFDFVIDCILEKKIPVNSFISHRVNFKALANEFQRLSDPKQMVIKAMVSFS